MENRLLPEVERLITEHINSVEQLEILLLLYNHVREEGQAAPDWTALTVSQELRIKEKTAAERLSDLAARGFLSVTASQPPQYRYNPASAEQDETVGLLARAYSTQRVTIINYIFSREIDKLRTFAEAFRLREDKS